jgi:hypothetical protein
MFNYAGIPVHVSPLCTATKRVREHVKRRTQSDAYHARIDKKWRKRFGTKQVPTLYFMDGRAVLGMGERIMVHPSLLADLRKHLEATP